MSTTKKVDPAVSVQRELARYWAERAQRAERAAEGLMEREEALLEELRECVPWGSEAAGVLRRHGVDVPRPRSARQNLAVLSAELRAFEESRSVRVRKSQTSSEELRGSRLPASQPAGGVSSRPCSAGRSEKLSVGSRGEPVLETV